MSLRTRLGALSLVLWLAACPQPGEDCAAPGDEDGNGLADCQDTACSALAACAEDCTNGTDDNGNGTVDCQDIACANDPVCQPEVDCTDGVDNDNDGNADCADTDCTGNAACTEVNCTDGVDNDNDGSTDCADTDCAGAQNCVPEADCANNADDEGDGLVDCDDPDCAASANCVPEADCANNTDDDLDGLVDCLDADCAADVNCQPEAGFEVEPNNSQAEANNFAALSINNQIKGSKNPSGDLDYFRVTVAPGTSATLRAETLDSVTGTTCASLDIDSELTLFDAAGTSIANNDDGGAGFCSLIEVGLTEGDYFVELRASDFDPTLTFDYTLQIELTPIVCGDDILATTELCDTTQVGAEDCVSQGFASGTLVCNATCDGFDTSACVPPVCGNNIIETGENCEDGNTTDGDGCSSVCRIETQLEAEVNNTATDALANQGSATPNASFEGAIDPGNDIDFFAIDVPAAASLRIETFDGNGPGNCASIDTVLAFFDTDGTTQLASNDEGGINSCSLLDSGTTAAVRDLTPGTYFVRVTDFGNNTVIPTYILQVSFNSLCGNGTVEGNESCDDGNLTNGDGCEATCQVCGDNILAGGEVCDGALLGGASCVSEGFASGTLACNTSCDAFDTNACVPSVCGNGITETGEQCDDGNNIDGDGCDAVCVFEVLAETEGNNNATDSVASQGQFTPNVLFAGATDPASDVDFFAIEIPAQASLRIETFDSNGFGSCTSIDTEVDLVDTDGTTVLVTDDDDGINNCSKIDSQVDAAARDLAPGVYFVAVNEFGNNAVVSYQVLVSFDALCGNNLVEGNEDCDDGNLINGDGCEATCQRIQVCGDGFVDAPEECDDGNTIAGDGCDANCVFEVLSELEPNNDSATAEGPFSTNVLLGGAIDPIGDKDFFAIELTTQGSLRIETFDSTGPGSCSGGIDTVIRLFNTDGTTQITSDDEGGINSCSLLSGAAVSNLAPGVYFLSVEDFLNNGLIAAYTVEIQFLP